MGDITAVVFIVVVDAAAADVDDANDVTGGNGSNRGRYNHADDVPSSQLFSFSILISQFMNGPIVAGFLM